MKYETNQIPYSWIGWQGTTVVSKLTRRDALMAMLGIPIARGAYAEPISRFHALLVGVSDYENEKIPKLRGPGNDVALLQQMLAQRGAPIQRLRVLTNGPTRAEASNIVGPPNRDDILAELDRLSFVAGPSDVALFHYSGHGCRTPQLPGARGGEADGLDEVILPADTKSWNGRIGFVENAIRDDEIGRALRRVQAVCPTIAIFDNCFSNTATKAAFTDDGLEIAYRAVSPSSLGLPDFGGSASAKESELAAKSTLPDLKINQQSPSQSKPLIALYATPENRRAPELKLPGPDGSKRVYGVFTWLLARTLADSSVHSVAHLFAGADARRFSELSQISRALTRKTPAPILDDPAGQSHSISLSTLN